MTVLKKMHIKSLHTLTANKYFNLYGLPTALYSLFALGLILLLWFNSKESDLVDNSKAVESSVAENVNLSLISSWHLFGFDKEAKFQKVENANIKLVGIIFDNSNSKAILMVNAKELVLHKGEKIDNNYSIQKIEPSRVIVTTNEGSQEIDLFSTLEAKTKPKNENQDQIQAPTQGQTQAIIDAVNANVAANINNANPAYDGSNTLNQSNITNSYVPTQPNNIMRFKRGGRY